MTSHRTTIRLDEHLYRRAKALSARDGRTVSEVIEDAIRRALDRAEESAGPLPDLPTFGGSGVHPGVDLTDLASVVEHMDEDRLDAMR